MDERDPVFKNWDIGLAVFLVIATLLVFWVSLKPLAVPDSVDYFFTAAHPLDKTFATTVFHRHLRYGLIWPIWAIQQVFGYSELSYYALPLVGLLSLVLGTFFLGRLLFSRLVGVFAALFLLLDPVVLRASPHPLPDFISTGLFTLGFVILVFLAQKGVLSTGVLSLSSRIFLLIAGLLLGWSYLTREYTVILFPVVAYLLFVYRAKVQSVLWLGSTVILCFLAEFTWNWIVWGDPLIRYSVSITAAGAVETEFEKSVPAILWRLPQLWLDFHGTWVNVLLLAIAMIGSLLLWRRVTKLIGSVSYWFISGWTFLTIVSFAPFITGKVLLATNNLRYWVLIYPPMLLLALGFFAMLMNYLSSVFRIKKASFALVPAIFAILFLIEASGSIKVLDANGYLRNGNTYYQEFREFLRQKGRSYKVIWLNQGGPASSGQSVPVYLNEWHGLSTVWNGEIKYYNTDPDNYLELGQITEGLLVLDLSNKQRLFSTHTIPDYFLDDLALLGEPIFASSGKLYAFEMPPQ